MRARDRIVSPVRMGGGTFIWLKTGRGAPESAKQAEIGVAGLRKIVTIGPVAGRRLRAGKESRKLQGSFSAEYG